MCTPGSRRQGRPTKLTKPFPCQLRVGNHGTASGKDVNQTGPRPLTPSPAPIESQRQGPSLELDAGPRTQSPPRHATPRRALGTVLPPSPPPHSATRLPFSLRLQPQTRGTGSVSLPSLRGPLSCPPGQGFQCHPPGNQSHTRHAINSWILLRFQK